MGGKKVDSKAGLFCTDDQGLFPGEHRWRAVLSMAPHQRLCFPCPQTPVQPSPLDGGRGQRWALLPLYPKEAPKGPRECPCIGWLSFPPLTPWTGGELCWDLARRGPRNMTNLVISSRGRTSWRAWESGPLGEGGGEWGSQGPREEDTPSKSSQDSWIPTSRAELRSAGLAACWYPGALAVGDQDSRGEDLVSLAPCLDLGWHWGSVPWGPHAHFIDRITAPGSDLPLSL